MGKFGNFGVGIDLPAGVIEDGLSGRTVGSDLLQLLGHGLTGLGASERQRTEHDRDYNLRVKSEADNARLRQAQIDSLSEDRAARRADRASQEGYVTWDPDTGRVVDENDQRGQPTPTTEGTQTQELRDTAASEGATQTGELRRHDPSDEEIIAKVDPSEWNDGRSFCKT